MDIKYSLNGKYHQYNKPFRVSKLGTTISLIISILFLIFGVVINNNIGAVLIVISIIVFSFFIAFVVALRYYSSIIKNVGNFEGLDIQDNKIIYICEKKGQKIIVPEQISKIRINRGRHNIYRIEVLIVPWESFMVPDAFASQTDVIDKFKRFAVQNNIEVIN